MNRYRIIVIIFVVGFFKFSYSQSGVKPAGIYEVGDTTIEVYHWKDPYAIREFKIINGTETILYRSFNRLTKKIQEEGTFKGGYSSGMWKFYGWTGRLKKEVSYDNMVKTWYEKKVELRPEELFDFAKFKEDSIFVEKYRRQKLQAANKNIVHDTVYVEKPVPTGVTVNITTPSAAVKTNESAVDISTAAQPEPVNKPAVPAPIKKETPAPVLTKPTDVKPADPTKSAPVPVSSAPVKKETPAPVAAKPTEIKPTEPAKPAPVPVSSAPVKKETPAPVAAKPTEIKPAKPAPAPVAPAPVKKETPAPVAAKSTEVKPAEPVKPVAAPAAPAPVKKEAPVPVAAKPTEVKPAEPAKSAAAPAAPAAVKKETPAPVVRTPAEAKSSEPAKPTPAPASPAPVRLTPGKKEISEEQPAKAIDDQKEEVPAPTPAKQKGDAALMEQQQTEQTETNEEVAVATEGQTEEQQVEPTYATQQEEAVVTKQQPTEHITTQAIQQANIVASEQKIKTEQQIASDSTQQKPTETALPKAEEKSKPLNKNYYYGWRANGNWFEISNLRPNEFVMRYDTRTEDRSRFSFYEFALDSIGKLKKEKVIAKASDLKHQPLLQLHFIDSLALVYGMQAMDKPFSHVLEYTVDSTNASNARFELYITGMPYNKKIEENRITEPFDFIVLDPWTGELINKGNGSAVTDNDNELSIRMTTLIKNQDVQ
jgi:hypothetical protein